MMIPGVPIMDAQLVMLPLVELYERFLQHLHQGVRGKTGQGRETPTKRSMSCSRQLDFADVTLAYE